MLQPQSNKMHCSRRAFTLVELLVVIAIIGILAMLLMGGAQSGLEAARRLRCRNNVYQLGRAVLQHEQRHGQFPTGGWGWHWLGDPDRGFNKRQPGGWVYNILPFIEQENLYLLPKDGQPNVVTEEQRQKTNVMAKTPLKIFNCPTRRRTMLYPAPSNGTFVGYNSSRNTDADNVQARSDYAFNSGSQKRNEWFSGPSTLAKADDPSFGWHDTSNLTGLSYERSEIGFGHIHDGTSFTLMLGEKYLNADHYMTGRDPSDNENMYTGFNNDNFRVTYYAPRQDRAGYTATYRFGSAHSAGVHMAFCDGSARIIRYSIDPETFRSLGHRSDGINIDPDTL